MAGPAVAFTLELAEVRSSVTRNKALPSEELDDYFFGGVFGFAFLNYFKSLGAPLK